MLRADPCSRAPSSQSIAHRIHGMNDRDLIAEAGHQIRQIVDAQCPVDAIGQLQGMFPGGDNTGPGVEAVFEPHRGKQRGFERRRVLHRQPRFAHARQLLGPAMSAREHEQ